VPMLRGRETELASSRRMHLDGPSIGSIVTLGRRLSTIAQSQSPALRKRLRSATSEIAATPPISAQAAVLLSD